MPGFCISLGVVHPGAPPRVLWGELFLSACWCPPPWSPFVTQGQAGVVLSAPLPACGVCPRQPRSLATLKEGSHPPPHSLPFPGTGPFGPQGPHLCLLGRHTHRTCGWTQVWEQGRPARGPGALCFPALPGVGPEDRVPQAALTACGTAGWTHVRPGGTFPTCPRRAAGRP